MRWLVIFLLLFLSACDSGQPRLRVAMGMGEFEWQVMRQDIIPPFEKKHGVKVEAIQVEPNDLPQIIEAQARAKRVRIDLFAQDNMQLAYLVNRDLVEDLSLIEADLPKEIIPSLVRAGCFKGKLYFLPYRPNVQITFYNRRAFRKYGLRIPRNWDELYWVAKRLKWQTGRGKILFKAYGGAATATQLYEWIISAGGDPLTINDDGCIETFLFLKKLWPYVSADSIRAKYDTSNEYITRDSAYLMQNWPFGIRTIVKDYGKEDIVTYHGFAGPAKEAHIIGGEVLGIPKGAPNKALALKFIKYLQSKDVQEKFLTKLGWPPIRSDAYASVKPWLKPYFQSIKEAMSYGVFRRNVTYWNEYVKYINEAFTEIVIQGKPVRKTLDFYHDQLELDKQRM